MSGSRPLDPAEFVTELVLGLADLCDDDVLAEDRAEFAPVEASRPTLPFGLPTDLVGYQPEVHVRGVGKVSSQAIESLFLVG